MRKRTKDIVAAATARLPRLEGQGVLIRDGKILTAAHCIAWTAEGGMVLGDYFIEPVRFGQGKFKLTPILVEAVSDIAVLGILDDQAFPSDCEAWETFCESAEPVEICKDDFPVFETFPAYVLTHMGEWVECKAQKCNETAHSLQVEAQKQIRGGTSGGPVVTNGGRLLGVVSNFSEADGAFFGTVFRPHLTLPPWLLRTVLPA